MKSVRASRWWSLLSVVTGGMLLALGAAPEVWAGTVPPPAPRLDVMSFNVCGAVCRHGEVRATAHFVTRVATRRGAEVVLLQELCYSQFRPVRALLTRHGFSARFAAQTSSRACAGDDRHHGTAFGVAVLVRGRVTHSVVDPLPTAPGAEPRVLLGVTATIDGRRTFVAGVHLSPAPRDGLRQQLHAVERFVAPRAGGPAVIGGDFNTLPGDPALGPMFARFTELDETRGAALPTYAAKKIDYVFVSRRQFTRPRAATVVTALSDHRVYMGSVSVTPAAGRGSAPPAGRRRR